MSLLLTSGHAQTKEVLVYVRDAADATALLSLDLDMSSCCGSAVHPGSHARILINSPEEEARLRSAGLQPRVVHRDLQEHYRSRLAQASAARHGPLAFAQGSMGGFFTDAEVVAFLDALQAQHLLEAWRGSSRGASCGSCGGSSGETSDTCCKGDGRDILLGHLFFLVHCGFNNIWAWNSVFINWTSYKNKR